MRAKLTRGDAIVTIALFVTHIAAAGASYYYGSLNVRVGYGGLGAIDTMHILSATVASLQQQNKLLVFTYKGSTKVNVEQRWWVVFSGRQELNVPAVVNYYVDLSRITDKSFAFDEKAKSVTVRLPRLSIGDIGFRPEEATTINGGILTWSEAQIEELRKMNYMSARRAMFAQANDPGLVTAAKQQAISNVQNYFDIPLRIAGHPEIKVTATFD